MRTDVPALRQNRAEVLGFTLGGDDKIPVIDHQHRNVEDREDLLQLVAVANHERLAVDRALAGVGEPLALVSANGVDRLEALGAHDGTFACGTSEPIKLLTRSRNSSGSSGPVGLVGEVQARDAIIRQSADFVRRIPDVASVSAQDKEDGAINAGASWRGGCRRRQCSPLETRSSRLVCGGSDRPAPRTGPWPCPPGTPPDEHPNSGLQLRRSRRTLR